MVGEIKKMKILKFFGSAIYSLVILILIFIAVTTAFSVIKGPGGYRFFVVQSGSMEPKIKTGSVVLVMPQKDYQKEDIITFLANPKANLKRADATITHRLIELKNDNNTITYTTKGDANNASDREAVSPSSVLGKVMISVPYVGYAIAFTKTQTGFIILIVVPATLIIYSEILNIKNEISLMIKKQKEKSKS